MTRNQAIRQILEAFEVVASQADDSFLVQDEIQDGCIAALHALGVTAAEMLAVVKQAVREEEATT